jgi:hypothetical protein
MIAAVLTRDPDPMRHAGPLARVIAGLLARDPDQRLNAATARDAPVSRATAWLVAMNAVLGMPVGIAVALVVVVAVGAGLGALLAPRLERWIGLPAALLGSVLITGESFVSAVLLMDPQRPIAPTALCRARCDSVCFRRSCWTERGPLGAQRGPAHSSWARASGATSSVSWVRDKLPAYNGNIVTTVLGGAGPGRVGCGAVGGSRRTIDPDVSGQPAGVRGDYVDDAGAAGSPRSAGDRPLPR